MTPPPHLNRPVRSEARAARWAQCAGRLPLTVPATCAGSGCCLQEVAYNPTYLVSKNVPTKSWQGITINKDSVVWICGAAGAFPGVWRCLRQVGTTGRCLRQVGTTGLSAGGACACAVEQGYM